MSIGLFTNGASSNVGYPSLSLLPLLPRPRPLPHPSAVAIISRVRRLRFLASTQPAQPQPQPSAATQPGPAQRRRAREHESTRAGSRAVDLGSARVSSQGLSCRRRRSNRSRTTDARAGSSSRFRCADRWSRVKKEPATFQCVTGRLFSFYSAPK